MNGIIYMYTSPIGKKYIGQTWNESQRKYDHKHPNGGCTVFHKAIIKYGYEKFIYEILHTGINDQKELDRLEALEITERKTLSPHGYNLKISGQCGLMSDEMKEKMSKAQMGRTHTKETKEKMSAWQIGKVHSESTRKKISEKHMGKKLTADALAAISKKVLCVETGIIYDSIKLAGIALGYIDGSAVSHCLNGKAKTSGGYHWEFVSE